MQFNKQRLRIQTANPQAKNYNYTGSAKRMDIGISSPHSDFLPLYYCPCYRDVVWKSCPESRLLLKDVHRPA